MRNKVFFSNYDDNCFIASSTFSTNVGKAGSIIHDLMNSFKGNPGGKIESEINRYFRRLVRWLICES